MKATSLTRKLDALGRIVLPKEIRESMNIKESDNLEIYVSESEIILRKPDTACVICSSENDLKAIDEKNICQKCVEKIKAII